MNLIKVKERRKIVFLKDSYRKVVVILIYKNVDSKSEEKIICFQKRILTDLNHIDLDG